MIMWKTTNGRVCWVRELYSILKMILIIFSHTLWARTLGTGWIAIIFHRTEQRMSLFLFCRSGNTHLNRSRGEDGKKGTTVRREKTKEKAKAEQQKETAHDFEIFFASSPTQAHTTRERKEALDHSCAAIFSLSLLYHPPTSPPFFIVVVVRILLSLFRCVLFSIRHVALLLVARAVNSAPKLEHVEKSKKSILDDERALRPKGAKKNTKIDKNSKEKEWNFTRISQVRVSSHNCCARSYNGIIC